jgi:hypothetical protein
MIDLVTALEMVVDLAKQSALDPDEMKSEGHRLVEMALMQQAAIDVVSDFIGNHGEELEEKLTQFDISSLMKD